MKIEGTFWYKKALVITPEKVRELEKLCLKYCEYITYEATTVADTNIKFASMDELLDYDNFQNRQIKSLTITGRKDVDRIIECIFEADNLVLLTAYGRTFKCHYYVSTVDIQTTLMNDISIFLKKITAPYWWLGKPRLFGIVTVASLLFSWYQWMFGSSTSEKVSISMFFVMIFFVIFLLLTILLIDYKILGNLFPPISFVWGEGKNSYQKGEKLRSQLLWGIIAAIFVGIIANIIFNQLPVS